MPQHYNNSPNRRPGQPPVRWGTHAPTGRRVRRGRERQRSPQTGRAARRMIDRTARTVGVDIYNYAE